MSTGGLVGPERAWMFDLTASLNSELAVNRRSSRPGTSSLSSISRGEGIVDQPTKNGPLSHTRMLLYGGGGGNIFHLSGDSTSPCEADCRFSVQRLRWTGHWIASLRGGQLSTGTPAWFPADLERLPAFGW